MAVLCLSRNRKLLNSLELYSTSVKQNRIRRKEVHKIHIRQQGIPFHLKCYVCFLEFFPFNFGLLLGYKILFCKSKKKMRGNEQWTSVYYEITPTHVITERVNFVYWVNVFLSRPRNNTITKFRSLSSKLLRKQ